MTGNSNWEVNMDLKVRLKKATNSGQLMILTKYVDRYEFTKNDYLKCYFVPNSPTFNLYGPSKIFREVKKDNISSIEEL